MLVTAHVSDKITASTTANGLLIHSLNDDLTEAAAITFTPALSDDHYSLTATLTAAQWATLHAGSILEVAITDSLRADTWPAIPVLAPPAWAQKLYGASSSLPSRPWLVRDAMTTLDAFAATVNGTDPVYKQLYHVESLYSAATTTSAVRAGVGFQALPFVEPANGFAYARARWYDATTGTFLTPDGMGYTDSANLYAGFAGDPVNHRDPTGTVASVSMRGVIVGTRPDGTHYRIDRGTDPVDALRILERDPDIRTGAEQEDILTHAGIDTPFSSERRAGEACISSRTPNNRAYQHYRSDGHWIKNALIATSGLPPQNREQQLVQGGLQIAGTAALVVGGTYGNAASVSAQPVFETRGGTQVGVNSFMEQNQRFVPTVIVYRAEGPANARVTIDPNGEVRISDGQGMLFLNFGDQLRAQEFFAKRLGQKMFGVSTKSFEVPRWFMLQLEQEAVSERAERRVPGAPLVVDETKAPNQYGLRPPHVDQLRDVIVPGSGKDR